MTGQYLTLDMIPTATLRKLADSLIRTRARLLQSMDLIL